MLSLTKDIAFVFETEWEGDPVIGGWRWSVMSCGATNDEDVMTAYIRHSDDVILILLSPLGYPPRHCNLKNKFPLILPFYGNSRPSFVLHLACMPRIADGIKPQLFSSCHFAAAYTSATGRPIS